MSANDQPPVTPGQVRANQWENRVVINPLQATLSMLDALPDRNCSLAPQSSSGSALVGTIKRWENVYTPPEERALLIFSILPDWERTLFPQIPCLNTARTDSRGVFTVFRNLPSEIRIMVWEFALPTARRINIRNNAMRHDTRHSRKNPAILYVNYESYQVAIKHLVPLFDGVNMIGSEQFKYINPKIDVVHFDNVRFSFSLGPYPTGHRNMLGQEPMKECDKIIDIEFSENCLSDRRRLLRILFSFRNLERLRLLYTLSRSMNIGTHVLCRIDFIREIYKRITLDSEFLSNWFRWRFDHGLINKLPEIIILPTHLDRQIIFSEPHYSQYVFGVNLARLKS
ncbi:hypothetical protein NHQ30_005600 [Ciborinia camelliae]|nr:hypothetical protein NHQ30_005600 [Ciborinia camelliae]